MLQMSEDDLRRILGEVLVDELKIIHEYLDDIPVIKQKVTRLEEDMYEVKTDIKAIKAAVKGQSKQVHNHEIRLTKLEAAR